MTGSQREDQIKELLHAALELDENERDDFLDRAVDDQSVRADVRSLIEAHEQAGDFLAEPDFDVTERPGDIIGRYQLIRLIGEGGFGRVYLAQQHEPVSRQVALKIIKLGMDTRHVIARFDAERQVLAMMEHPSIATVFDAGGTKSGRPYFVMELVRGIPITDFCDVHALSVEQRLGLFREVCLAVQHAHIKGIIHRDIKPSNVLVADPVEAKSVPIPKVIDFGVAKATSTTLSHTSVTQHRQFIGTLEYMCPEQADPTAADIDTRADVYSLGVLLFELLTGVTPFDGERLRSSTHGEWQRIIREEEPPRPSARLSGLSSLPTLAAKRSIEPRRLTNRLRGDLDWITLRALEKDRNRRYDSAAALADDVNRHLKHEPVLAGPPGAAYRVRKFARRHRVGVLATSLIAITLVVGAAGTTVGMLQARRSADDARDTAKQAHDVNAFMQEILTSVTPQESGADVRLVEVLANASGAAQGRFADHPLLEAQVRDMLGAVYADLSMFRESKAEFMRAITLWRDNVGPDDPRALHSEQKYCGSSINLQEIDDVAQLLPDLAGRMQRVLGPDNLATLDVQRSIALVHLFQGRIDEAERMFLDLRAKLTAIGEDDELEINLLRNLIRVNRVRAQNADGASREAIMAQIEQLARERIDRSMRLHGPNSVIALEARAAWAQTLEDQGEHELAAQTCRAVLDESQGRFGDCHVVRLLAMTVLRAASHRLGDSATAADLSLKSIDCVRRMNDALDLIVEISDALPLLDRGGRWSEGEGLAREYAEEAHKLGGHRELLYCAELYIARFVSLQQRFDEAEAIFQSLLNRTDEAAGSNAILARLHLFRGSNLCRRAKFEEAEQELQTSADLLDDFRLGTSTTSPDDVLLAFIDLYEAWDKFDKAKEYRALRDDGLTRQSAVPRPRRSD